MLGPAQTRGFRAFYPEIRFRTATFAQTDSRLSFGHVPGPGTYATTITRPDLFEGYLEQQIALLIENHDEPVVIGVSDTAMPVHFAVSGEVAVPQEGALQFTLRDVFDVPDLATTNDDIVNGIDVLNEDGSKPLAPFTAQRIDYSLARLQHYTATNAEHFQNHVLFTNYQFYVEEFEAYAREMLADKSERLHVFCVDWKSGHNRPCRTSFSADKDAADANLSPVPRRWWRDYLGEYWGRVRPMQKLRRTISLFCGRMHG